jgi:hypothetical protein
VRQQEAEATHVIEEQVQTRPLQKAQEALHAVAVDKQKEAAADTDEAAKEKPPDIPVTLPEQPVAGEEAVLKDDDNELERLRTVSWS